MVSCDRVQRGFSSETDEEDTRKKLGTDDNYCR